MFVGSVRKPEELPWKIADHQIELSELMYGGSFDEYLTERFPEHQKYYQERRIVGKTTWSVQPSVQLALFETLRGGGPGELDYIFAHADPQPGQVLGAEEVQRGLDAMNGKSILDIINWCYGEGIDLRFEIYER